MGGDRGGSRGSTVIQQQQQPPQLLPESREGFTRAQEFYKGILGEPPIFGGERLAPVSPLQREAIFQTVGSFGAPTPIQTTSEEQLLRTMTGDYLYGPAAQAAAASLAAPIFQRFNTEVLPGIRDRSQVSGQGLTGSRRAITEGEALERFGRSIAEGAIAPIFEGERGRQITAAQESPRAFLTEQLRLGQLTGAGAAERAFAQEPLDVEREKFEEPIFRRGEAASALLGSGGVGPGGGTTTSREYLTGMQQVQQFANLGMTLAAMAKLAR